MHKRISAIRKHIGLSQREFGEKIGVSRDVISNLEYNRVKPKELLLKQISERYGVNKKWLSTGEGEMFDKEQPRNKKLEKAIALFADLQPEFQEYALEQIKQIAKLQSKRRSGTPNRDKKDASQERISHPK